MALVDVELKIKRYNPEQDTKPHWETYEVRVEDTDRVVDALHEVKWHHDGTLSFRRSCVHGVCGADAVRRGERDLPGIGEVGFGLGGAAGQDEEDEQEGRGRPPMPAPTGRAHRRAAGPSGLAGVAASESS